MELSDIREEVRSIIQDDSFSNDTIDGWINESLDYAASLADLPDLKRLDSVSTGSNPYVSLTGLTEASLADWRVVNRSGYGPVAIFNNLDSLLDEYSDSDYPALTRAVVWKL